MLKRLISVSEGYRGTAVQRFFGFTSRSGPNSLNSPARHQEFKRIQAENTALVKRLNQNPGTLNHGQYLHDFERSRKYQRQISKPQLINVRPKNARLPPVNASPRHLQGSSLLLDDLKQLPMRSKPLRSLLEFEDLTPERHQRSVSLLAHPAIDY